MTRASNHKKPGLVPILGAALCAAASHPAAAQAPMYTVTDLGTLGGPSSIAQGLNNNGQTVGTADLSANLGDAFLFSYAPALPPSNLPMATLLDLGTNGGRTSDARAINSVGEIVGFAGTHAFVRPGTSLIDIGTLGGADSTAFGIDDSALVVGGSETGAVDSMSMPIGHAFAHSGTSTIMPSDDLGVLSAMGLGPFIDSTANGVNPAGQVVGTSFSLLNAFSRATLFTPAGTPQDLGVIAGGTNSEAYAANNTIAVGDSDSGGNSFLPVTFSLSGAASGMPSAFSLGIVSGFTNGTAFGVNAAGSIVGNAYNTDGKGNTLSSHGFLYVGSSLNDLNTLLTSNSTNTSANDLVEEAFSINDFGQIAADGLINKSGPTHALLLSPTTTVTGLSQTLVAPNTANFTLVVTGTNFAPNAVVYFNGKPESTTYNSPTQVTATIASAGSAGTSTVDVGTPTPGGNSKTLQVGTTTTVSGTVTLQSYMGTEPGLPIPTLTFVLTPNGATSGGPITATFQPTPVASPPNSNFTYMLTGVPPGTYTLGVKGPIWEREDAPVNTTSSSQTGVNVTLPAGDVNNDNNIDGTDFAILSGAYGSKKNDGNFNQNADLNGDGFVDGTDFAILSGNYGTMGKPN